MRRDLPVFSTYEVLPNVERITGATPLALRREFEPGAFNFEIDLKRNGRLVDHGRATNVLGGPCRHASLRRYSCA